MTHQETHHNAPLYRGYVLLFAVLPWSLVCAPGTWTIQLPSEPLMALLGLALGIRVFRHPELLYNALKTNLLFFLSAIWIGWLAISAVFSTLPVVSWKYWIVEAGQWWVFAGGMALLPGLWKRILPVFMASMALMVLYTLGHHAMYDFRVDQSLLGPLPFFPDHTMYAAVLALLLPWVVWYYRSKPKRQFIAAVLLFGSGLWFAYCRAAALSVLASGLVYFSLRFRKSGQQLLLVTVLMLGVGFLFRLDITGAINRKLTTDVSTQERLNRYDCAAQMVCERPGAGFGPGTFQFRYLPYQRPELMTRISIRSDSSYRDPSIFGRGGGAHSEYWQTLAETGLTGCFFYLSWVSAFLWIALFRFFQAENKEDQAFILACFLSLLTFFVHAFFNNMLHDGRVAALVWGQLSLLGGNWQTKK